MASLPKISVARNLAHLSRSLSGGFISRAAAAATGVSRAMKWFPACGRSQSRPLSAKAHIDKKKKKKKGYINVRSNKYII